MHCIVYTGTFKIARKQIFWKQNVWIYICCTCYVKNETSKACPFLPLALFSFLLSFCACFLSDRFYLSSSFVISFNLDCDVNTFESLSACRYLATTPLLRFTVSLSLSSFLSITGWNYILNLPFNHSYISSSYSMIRNRPVAAATTLPT